VQVLPDSRAEVVVMRRSRRWHVPAILVALWVLAANVFVSFPRARTKLVETPLPPQQRVVLPLAQAVRTPGDRLVLVYRLRNIGPALATISARTGDRVLRDVRIAPGVSKRFDLAWERPRTPLPTDTLELVGSSSTWVVEYAELANLHGYTVGAVEFLILPDAQRFEGPPPWSWALCAGSLMLVFVARPRRWWLPARAAHGALSALVALLFVAAALSPFFSEFRVVLSVHTFVFGLVVIWLPQGLDLIARASQALAPPALAVARRVARLPWRRIAVMAGVVTYAALLWFHLGAYAGGSDSSGYLNSARLLARWRVSTPLRTVAGLPANTVPSSAWVPVGFKERGSDAMVPTYPIGLPLAVAAAAQAVGWPTAPGAVMVLHALAGVFLVFRLGRACGIPTGTSGLAALLLATSPLYLFMSLTVMSDTPALVWTTTAVLLAWKSRDHPAWAGAAGLAMSTAVLVRPTNVLVIVPVALCLGLAWRRWLALIVGGIPGAVLLITYNLAAYGSALTTGYGDMSRHFGMDSGYPSLRNYVTWLPVLLTPLGMLAFGLPLLARRAGRLAIVLTAWAAVFLAFYAFYYFTHEAWWSLRFLLPAFPPLIVGALWVGSASIQRWLPATPHRRAMAIAGVTLALSLMAHNAFWVRRLAALDIGHGERVYVETTSWMSDHVPSHAVVLAMQLSGALYYYTEFPVLDWQTGPGSLRRLESHLLATNRPLYAVFFPYETEERKALDRIPGRWELVGKVRDVTVWRLVGER
jgi:hypothetical protein